MPRPETTAARLAFRQVRRGALIIVATALVFVVAGVSGYDATSLGGSTGLSVLVANPSVRALYGMPFDLTTAGGFAVWRVGVFLSLAVGLWGLLTVTRILRGEEEVGRWDLMLATPLGRRGLLTSHLLVLIVISVATGVATTAGFLLLGQAVAGAVLYGAGIALLTITFVGVGAVTSQLFGTRRRAAGAAGAVLGVSYAIRMVADGSNAAWLRWVSPIGWVENLQAYGGNVVVALVPLVVAPVALVGTALALERGRDTDEGVIRDAGTATAHVRYLRDPLGFAWRQRWPGMVWWAGGLGLFSVVLGAITKSFVEFIAGDPQIVELMNQFGLTSIASVSGFVASVDAVSAIAFCLYAVTGIHQCWEDEQTDRLDLVYARPVGRTGWFGAQTFVTALTAFVALLSIGVGTWIGARLTGVDFSIADSLAAVLNLAPLLVVFLGLAALVHGVRPELGVLVAGGAVVVGYLLTLLGPAVKLPEWIIKISPFAQLSAAPADPVNWTGTIALCAIGVAFTVVGFASYARRDLR